MGHYLISKMNQTDRFGGLGFLNKVWLFHRCRLLRESGIIPEDAVDDKTSVSLLGGGKLINEVQDIALEHDSCRYSFDFFHASILA